MVATLPYLRQFIARGQRNKADRRSRAGFDLFPYLLEVSQAVERVEPSATLSRSSEVLMCGDEFARVMGLSAGSSRDSRAQVVAKNGYRKFARLLLFAGARPADLHL
jgi:hypothetical protein